MRNGTWFDCKNPRGVWPIGEYLIETAPKAGVCIWFNNSVAVSGMKTMRAAHNTLSDKFGIVVKIKR